MNNYADLFKYPYDNNAESLFELQWVYQPGSWGVQNSAPAYLAYSPDIANGDGWGGDKGATWWMLSQYDGFAASGDTMLKAVHLIKGLKQLICCRAQAYPEITQTLNGVDQKLIFPYVTGDVNFASIKKYVIGKAEDVGWTGGSATLSQ